MVKTQKSSSDVMAAGMAVGPKQGDREPIIVNISHESKSVRNSEAAIWQWMCLIG